MRLELHDSLGGLEVGNRTTHQLDRLELLILEGGELVRINCVQASFVSGESKRGGVCVVKVCPRTDGRAYRRHSSPARAHTTCIEEHARECDEAR